MNMHKALWKGSLVLLITINIYFVLNYFFHFAMARMLAIAEYGVVVALYNIIYLLNVFAESIQTVVSKYATEKEDRGEVKNLLKKSTRKALKVSIYLFLAYLVIAIGISFFLNISYFLVAFTGLVIFFSFLIPVNRGVLQGRKKFKGLGLNMILESFAKLVLAIVFVFIGWKAFGAMVATVLALLLSFLASFLALREFTRTEEKKTETAGIYNYTAPVFLVTLSVMLFFTLDVFFARYFFEPEVAGFYALASTIAKSIFFGTLPVAKAMFPLSSESKTTKGSEDILKNALLILLALIVAGLLIVYFFPGILVRIFSGEYIQETISILIYPSIAVSLISFTNLMFLYKLSVGKIKNYYFPLFFVVIQIILFSLFHDNLLEFSLAFVAASAAFFWGSLILTKDG